MMADQRHVLARAYLAPPGPAQSFWRWSEDGEAIEWEKGATIAFRQEIQSILTHLARGGLPPFGAIVLLLAACRDGWLASPIFRWAEEHGLRIPNDWLKELLDGLDTIHALPTELRTSLAAKEVLAEVVFEDARHRLTPTEASQIVAALNEGIAAEQLAPDPVKKNALEWFRIERNTLVHGL